MERHLKKFGFFGGTFDPIHFGHLNLAVNMLEKMGLDEVLFCPANFSPTKRDNLPSANKHARKEMVELAIKGIPHFSLIDLELKREGPSYTIDTIRELQSAHPNTEFYLIIGEDMLPSLPRWKEVEALLRLAPPLIGTRTCDILPELPQSIHAVVKRGEIDMNSMDISSTELRLRLIQKKYCGHLVPSKVLDYIHAHQLYSKV